MKKLLADLERLQAGSIKAPDLMSVPVLNDWVHTFTIVSCLKGSLEGHPRFPDGHEVRTSEFITVLKDDGEFFARTTNSWYRLGSAGGIDAR
ncbi:hypothetical protein N7E02_08260 [Aliirhizobium terrae]|uniref:hypothetical protein n=1 Tax=Terrirhizobium terrae TaxID=2926709 RepID=UPI002575B97B|nr:hypothetical protein [Rhizobium sp. CC-CFT758]WJH40598.1 hypothetical protein N7E02_08260 [Rhizobium sp. CC-CFT758]